MTADPRFSRAARCASGSVPCSDATPLEEPAEPADPGYAAALAGLAVGGRGESTGSADAFATDLSGHGAFKRAGPARRARDEPALPGEPAAERGPGPRRGARASRYGTSPHARARLERKLEALVGTDWPWYPGGPGGQLTERFLLPLRRHRLGRRHRAQLRDHQPDGRRGRHPRQRGPRAPPSSTTSRGRFAERLLFPHVEPQTTPHTMARAEQALASDWDGQASPPAPEELRLFVTLAPGTHRVLLLSPASFCDFQQGSCLDERWVIGDRLEVLGPAGGSVETPGARGRRHGAGRHRVAESRLRLDEPLWSGRSRAAAEHRRLRGLRSLEVTQAGVHEGGGVGVGSPGAARARRARVVVVEDPAGEAFERRDPAAIRENLVHLHRQLLGEELDAEDPEIDATLALFQDLWTAPARRGASALLLERERGLPALRPSPSRASSTRIPPTPCTPCEAGRPS